MSITGIAPPRRAPGPPPAAPAAARRAPATAALPELPAPRPVAASVLAGALAKLSSATPELTLLALDTESNRLGRAAAEKMIDSLGSFIAAEHAANQEQLRKAIAAASSKAWWQKFLTAFRVLSIAASLATGGTVGTVAAGLMVAAWAVEKNHPKVALGLQLAAVGLLVGHAAANLLASGKDWVAAATAAWRAGTKYAAAGAQVGVAVGTAMVGHYTSAELRADAARLLATQLLEHSQQGQRDEIAFLKALFEQDARATRDCLQLGEQRHEAAATAIRA